MNIVFYILLIIFAWFSMAFISKNVWENYTKIRGEDLEILTIFSFIVAPILFAVAMAWIFGNGTYKWFGGKSSNK